MKIYFAVVALVVFALLSFSSELTVLESISVALFTFSFLELLYDLGKRIVIVDYTIQAALFTCLIMPMIFYHVYTNENQMARIWVKYMPISSNDYFSYALPAVVALAIGLRIPLKKTKLNADPTLYMQNVKAYLNNKPNLGLALIVIGICSGALNFFDLKDLRQVFFLMEHLTYVGVFYVLYSPYKKKRIIIASAFVVMVGQTIVDAMFGDFIYLLACSLTLILLGKKISFKAKLGYAMLGIFSIILLQSIKVDYRQKAWKEEGGADPLYFAKLISDRVTDVSILLDPNNLFFTSVRMNQGWLVAVTMKRVPDRYPYADGETIGVSVAAAIVPRFLWHDKPESGGKYNLKRFWGYNLVGYSMNIGPLGEGYANFSVIGGVIYMFFYGLFFNFMLSSVLKFSEKYPSLVLWLPFLFFYTISVETDLLTTMGSILKAIFFTWLVYKIFRIGFRIDL